MTTRVAPVSRSATHSLSKGNQLAMQLLAGLGVAGVTHLSVVQMCSEGGMGWLAVESLTRPG